jgi:hypothetical protein
MSQAALARKLSCSAMAVSRWERGAQEPPAEWYIQLGNLAGDPECWYFWGRAGLRSADLMQVFPSARGRMRHDKLQGRTVVTAGAGRHKSEQGLVAIPLLPVFAGTHGQVGDKILNLDQVQPEEMLAAPTAWCPHPGETMCLRVKGNSMAPLIHDGYIVAVDAFLKDRAKLADNIVIAWNKDVGLTISRLKAFDGVDVLVPENREYQSVTMGRDQTWRILGKVLWWIGRAS